MEWRGLLIAVCGSALFSCGPDTKPSPTASAAKQVPKPLDESRRFPMTNLVETKVVESHLMGKSFMPGGTAATYKRGKTGYEIFVARMASPSDAALLLPDWRNALADAKPVPSFGGYFGMDGGRPVFVFSKGAWIAGIAGLPQKAADAEARTLASRLN